MNQIYRLIWNKRLGQLVVTSEHARTGGGLSTVSTASGNTIIFPLHESLPLTLIALAVSLALSAPALAQTSVTTTTNIGAYFDSTWTNTVNNFILSGNADWGNTLPAFTAARTTFTLDGNGYTITVPSGLTGSLIPQTAIANPATASFSNLSLVGTATPQTLFSYTTPNLVSNLNFNDVTIQDFSNTTTSTTPVANIFNLSAVGAVLNVTAGGASGLTISSNFLPLNSSTSQSALVLNAGTMNFYGDVNFVNNTSNYAAAISMPTNTAVLNFNGPTEFTGNTNSSQAGGATGGAINITGSNETLTFNGPSTFDGNYQTSVTYQPGGGAIYVSPPENTGTATVTFNAPATFENNYVEGPTTPVGGAIYLRFDTDMQFNAPAIFINNAALGLTSGAGGGGAIRDFDATISFVSGTEFLDNNTTGVGGAIKSTGVINLNALSTGSILFEGNRQGVSYVGTTVTPGTGVPNAIYLDANRGILNLNTAAASQIIFDDPIYAVAGSTITKTGSGEVIFYGDHNADNLYYSDVLGNTSVQGGNFTLADGASYGDTTAGTFSLAGGATVSGDNGSSLLGQSIAISTGGIVNVTDGTFTLNSPAINLASGAELSGNGTLAATSNINLAAGAVIADITTGNNLNVSGTLAGPGGVTVQGGGILTLSGANTYTGATDINAGTLQGGAANVFAASSAVNVAAGTTLNLNNYNQSANNLSGAGNVTLESATLTANNNVNTTFDGVISGAGTLIKTGANTLTLSNAGSSIGNVNVNVGTLAFTQAGTFNTSGNYSTAAGATTTLANNATLNLGGSFTQASSSTLDIAIGGIEPEISAASATLGGTLNVTGVGSVFDNTNVGTLTSASALNNLTQYNLIHTTEGISNDFTTVNLDSTASPVDYISLSSGKSADQLDYNVGFALTWLAGTTSGNGNFTLANPGDTFNVDVALTNEAPSATGWNGQSLTKLGAGTLVLSANNTYSGTTTISAGTLQVGNGGTSGAIAGNIIDNANLRFDRSDHASYAGTVSGSGTLTQAGSGVLTLSGAGSSVGSANVAAGTLAFTQTGAFATSANYTTASGAATALAANATLEVAGTFTQAAGSTLDIAVGGTEPVISATTASLGGTLNVTGLSTNLPDTASALAGVQYNLIHTTGGISNDFSTLNLGSASSPLDYMTLSGSKSADQRDYNVGFALTWLAGTTSGNGNFTLANPGDTFNVDVALTNEAPSATGWDGQTLTKLGSGTLILSAANTYTGATNVNAGTLQAGVANAFIDSSAVHVAAGATLDLHNYNQIANNLAGAGNVTLGSAALTVDNNVDTTLSGVISGTGALNKTGANALTLSGDNTYSGTTTISAGTLQVGNGGTSGAIAGNIIDNANLRFDRSDHASYAGTVSGSGTLTQAGSGVLTLSGAGSSVGSANVAAGTLAFTQTGAFATSANYTTASGAATALAANATLEVAGTFTQAAGSTLDIAVGGTEPVISATTASLGGTLNVTGLSTNLPDTASALAGVQYNLIHTTGGISNDFSTLNLGSASSPLDYMTLSGSKSADQRDYNVGFALTWLAGTTSGNGNFTLANPGDTFNVDVALTNEAPSATGWDGQTLTKLGSGTLILSAANTYTGATNVNAGTLQAGVANAFIDSSAVHVAAGATLDLHNYNQIANNLAGAGNVTLGSAALTVDNNVDTTLSGVISGTGALNKTGANALTLSGTGSGVGSANVAAGTLAFTQAGAFTASGNYTTANGATTELAANAALNVGGNFTQAAGSSLDIVIDKTQPLISATSASLGGELEVVGIGNVLASTLIGSEFNVVHTTAGISNDFSSVGFGGAVSGVDYITLSGAKSANNLDYNIGFGLTWQEGGGLGNGVFLLPNTSDTFNVDVALANEAPSATGWDGQTLTKQGSGTLILSAENTYTGATNVEAGTLQAGIINAFADSSTVHVAAGATLDLHNYNQTVNNLAGAGNVTLGSAVLTVDDNVNTNFSGVISGTGGLTKNGADTLTLSGDNIYTGTTTINDGTLSGSATSFGTGPVIDDAALIINQNTNASFSNVISGSGSLTKQGAGTLTLSGNDTLSGPTTVAAGELAVNGTLNNSAVQVLSGATLAGSGSVGATTISNGGMIAPGSPATTLTVNGNLTEAAGSIYKTEVNPETHNASLIHVNGSANLAPGAVLAVARIGSGLYVPGTQYTVLTATDGVEGTFSLTGDIETAFVALSAMYDADDVYLISTLVNNFSSAAQTSNQASVANALQSLPGDNALKDAIAALDTADQARNAFDQLSGEIHASTQSQLIEESHFVRDAATDRLRQVFCAVGSDGADINAADIASQQTPQLALSACNPNQPQAWVRVFGSWGSTSGNGNAAEAGRSVSGMLAGVDTQVFDHWRVGMLTGVSRSSIDVNDRNASANSNDYDLGLYGGTQWGQLGLRMGLSYSWHDIDSQRSVNFPGYTDQLNASYTSNTTQLFGELGWQIDSGAVQYEPFANLAFVRQANDSFQESGGLAALAGQSDTMRTTFSTLGVRGATKFELGGVDLATRGMLGWRHAYGDTVPTSVLSLSGATPFAVNGVPVAKDAAVLELSLDAPVARNATLSISYTGQIGNGAHENGLRANMNWSF